MNSLQGADAPSAPSGRSGEESFSPALLEALDDIALVVDRGVHLPGSAGTAPLVLVNGLDAVAVWTELRSRTSETGHYPVIVGSYRDFGSGVSSEFEVTQQGWEFFGDELDSPADVIVAADRVDMDSWFAERADYLDFDRWVEAAVPPLGGSSVLSRLGDSLIDFASGGFHETVEIVLVPTMNGWEAPAYLLWGGWNDVPGPDVQVAILRYWHDRYAADVVAMTSDIVEVSVGEPPMTDVEAIRLAREYALYAPDSIWQGVGDMEELARSVLEAPAWFFWWD